MGSTPARQIRQISPPSVQSLAPCEAKKKLPLNRRMNCRYRGRPKTSKLFLPLAAREHRGSQPNTYMMVVHYACPFETFSNPTFSFAAVVSKNWEKRRRLLRAKFHRLRCKESSLWGEKVQNRPV